MDFNGEAKPEIVKAATGIRRTVRIVFTSPYAVQSASGISTMILRVTTLLKSLGHTVEVIAPDDAVGGPDAPRLTRQSMKGAGPFRNIALAWTTASKLLQRDLQVDVVHCQQEHLQSLAALLAARIRGAPGLVTIHLVSSPGRRGRHPRFIRGSISRLAKEVTFVCRHGALEFERPNGRVIHNGVDLDAQNTRCRARDDLRAELGLEDSFVLAFAGRVTATKGIYDLLRAFAQLSEQKRKADPRLLTFGPVPEEERAEYSARKHDLRIEDRVRDFGFRKDWRGYLTACDVFVLPSHYEGLPFSLLEAMAEGVSVVASNVGGIPEVVEHGRNGYLIEPNNPEELGRVLTHLSAHPEERRSVGEAAARTVAGRFSAAAMGEAYLRLYAQLADRSGS